MWMMIMAALILVLLIGIIYLITRFCKFSIIKKLSHENKWIEIFISSVLVIIVFVVSWLLLDLMNAIIILLHLAVIWLIGDFITFIVQKIRKQDFGRYYTGVLVMAFTVIYLCTGWYLANHVWRTVYSIDTNKTVGNIRIVLFSDSHIGTTFDGNGLQEYIDKMNTENPDVVLIPGDYVDDDTSKEDMENACKALGKLKTKYGVYFAFGNHDKGYYDSDYRGYDGDDLIAELEKNNVVVLQDENVLIDNRFYIIGRQDRSEEQRSNSRADMENLVKNIDKTKYSIVIDHQPYDYEAQAKSNVDMVLSGHTHGGQLIPINHVGEWTGENAKSYGHEKIENTDFIVTSGISDWALQFKTGCKSEYVVIDVKEKK